MKTLEHMIKESEDKIVELQRKVGKLEAIQSAIKDTIDSSQIKSIDLTLRKKYYYGKVDLIKGNDEFFKRFGRSILKKVYEADRVYYLGYTYYHSEIDYFSTEDSVKLGYSYEDYGCEWGGGTYYGINEDIVESYPKMKDYEKLCVQEWLLTHKGNFIDSDEVEISNKNRSRLKAIGLNSINVQIIGDV